MNLFTANQVSNVFVAPAAGNIVTSGNITNPGDLKLFETPKKDAVYFQHMGKGGLVRSDLIKKENILWATLATADEMAHGKEMVTVSLPSGESALVGQDYTVRIAFDNALGVSTEDSQYWKYGAVHVTSAEAGASNKDAFYKKLALSIVKNMSRESAKLCTVYVATSSSPKAQEVTATGTISASSITGVTLEQVTPPWNLGTIQQKWVTFTVTPGEVTDTNGNTFTWGEVTYYKKGYKYTIASDGTVGTPSAGVNLTVDAEKNSKLIADYEYFWMGERGDTYRNVGWPDVIKTEYFVNSALAGGYDLVTIHYAYVGSNESVQKSEKNLVLIVPAGQGNTLATNIQTATGVAIDGVTTTTTTTAP